MYSGGSLWAVRGLGRLLSSVRFIVNRKWLRKSCASSSGLLPSSLPTGALWWLSGGLMGPLKLTPVSVRSRTFRVQKRLRWEQTESVMAEWRQGFKSKVYDEKMRWIQWITANCLWRTPLLKDNRLLLGTMRKLLCPCRSCSLVLRAGLCCPMCCADMFGDVTKTLLGPPLSPRQEVKSIHNLPLHSV